MTVETFWQQVTKTTSCWLWTRCLDNYGYGVARLHGAKTMRVHQIAWILSGHSALSRGEVLHHTCRVRRCVNPSHLRLSNHREHPDSACGINAAKTHCPRGHAYSKENIYLWKTGRKCKLCMRMRAKSFRVA